MSYTNSNTILVVDDNLGARRSIEALLAHEDYRMLLASNGMEALEMINEEPPDLILLDVMMPGINGFEVCEAIRKHPTISEVPILMLTALDDEESTIRGIEAGADDFLTKPINKHELRSRVRGILRLNRYRKLCGERQKFEWVVQNSRSGFLVLDASFKLAFANPKALEILRLKSLDAANEDFFAIARRYYTFKPSDVEQSHFQKSGGINSEPFLLVRPQVEGQDASWIRATVLDLGKNLRDQMLIRLDDVTNNMLTFQERHTFSQMITHKLLTPLNALKAAEQMMANVNTAAGNISGLDHVLNLQKKGLDRLEYDIDSIVRFLQTTAEDRQAKHSTSIRRLLEIVDKLLADAGISYVFDPHPREYPRHVIDIHEVHFESSVREIIENAIKFHPMGTPTVECHPELNAAKDSIEFVFLNDGRGLSDSELSNAWKPYWQADRYFTGEIKGMGLGLALIATNVWSAGGTCSIENRTDQEGVLLRLSFPVSVAVPKNEAE